MHRRRLRFAMMQRQSRTGPSSAFRCTLPASWLKEIGEEQRGVPLLGTACRTFPCRTWPTRSRPAERHSSGWQDLAAGSDVWLVDHAVTFGRAEELAQGLEADASLLWRLAALMELPGARSSVLCPYVCLRMSVWLCVCPCVYACMSASACLCVCTHAAEPS